VLTRSLVICVLLLPCLAQGQVRQESDPTRPATAMADHNSQQVVTSKWQVSAIFTTASHMRAVINGKTVRPGDSVDEAKVLSIESSEVTIALPHTQQQHRLTLATSSPVKYNVSHSY